MSTKPVEVTDADFEAQVIKSDKAVLVDFWAPWCAPCRMVGPIVEELAEDMQDTIKVCKVNVDNNPIVAQTYEVRAIPTLILYVGGKPAARLVGVRPRADIEKEIQAALK
jgi:thioredoxin 1